LSIMLRSNFNTEVLKVKPYVEPAFLTTVSGEICSDR